MATLKKPNCEMLAALAVVEALHEHCGNDGRQMMTVLVRAAAHVLAHADDVSAALNMYVTALNKDLPYAVNARQAERRPS